MRVHPFFLFLIGFGLGLLFTSFFIQYTNVKEHIIWPESQNIFTQKFSANIPKNNSSDGSIEDVKKLRILCFINTRPKTHGIRVVHIMKTWGKHCDKILFASTSTDVNLGAIGFNLTDNHETMWGKVKLMLKHVHQNYIDDYDWFLKGDDDMFLMPENMRFLLSAYSPEDPIYFGHKFNTTEHKWGYFSGGSGYVMSRKTVRIFVEEILTNPEFYQKDHSHKCHVETDNETEDWHITLCLDYYNVYAGDSRDLLKRDRFFPFTPEGHLFGYPDSGYWYWQRKYYFNDEGLDCCSNYSVAYHYVGPKNMYKMYYLTYRLQPYGIKRQYPPPPKKKIFSEVARILDEERVNATLRGY